MSETPREHFFSLLHHFKNGMLITHTPEAELHARPMTLAKVENDGDLWLVTDVHSAKVDELAEDAHVSFAMQDGDCYVALSGKAEIVRDAELVNALWNEAWRTWFPEGVDDPSLVLLKIKPVRGEYWDNQGLNKAKFIYHAAKAYLTGTTPEPDVDVQAKVELQH